MKRLIPRWRKMTWAILVFTGIMFAWMIGGASSAANSAAADCAKDPAVTSGILSKQACIEASNVGTGIGVTLLFLLWFLGFVVLSLIWFMSRPRRRDCPACGEGVKRGLTVCKRCGHDFKQTLASGVATA